MFCDYYDDYDPYWDDYDLYRDYKRGIEAEAEAIAEFEKLNPVFKDDDAPCEEEEISLEDIDEH